MGFRNVNELKVATVRELVSPQFIFGGGGSVGCPRFSLKSTLLPGSPKYGYWYYDGFNSSTPAGPFNETPATNVFNPIGVTNQIGASPNPSISLENVTEGYYKLRYRHGLWDENGLWLGNEAEWSDTTVIVYLHPNDKCAGGDTEFSISGSSTIDLNSYLNNVECPVPTTGGVWTDNDGAGAAFNPANGQLNLGLLSSGSYSFTYSILPASFTDVQPISTCPNQSCLAQTATVTVNLDSGLVVTIANASEIATVTQVFRDPDTLQVGYVKAYVQNNVEAVTMHGQTYISDDKGIDAFVEDNIFRSVYHYTKMATGNRIKSGGHFTYLDVVKKDLTPIRIPLANDNAEGYQATLTGPYGNVNPADLLFDPFSIYDWIAAMEKVIKNYLSTQGYTQGTHYNLNRITVNQETATEYAVEIWFRSRHNPTGEWLGIEEGAASVAELDPENTMSYVNNHDMAHGLDLNPIEFESFNTTVLGCVNAADLLTHYRVVNEALVIDTFACNHFTIVLQGSSIPATAVSISNTKQCTSTKLTASASPCSGTLTYSWDNGDSDAITYGWPGNGTLTVTANCDNPVDSDNETYTL